MKKTLLFSLLLMRFAAFGQTDDARFGLGVSLGVLQQDLLLTPSNVPISTAPTVISKGAGFELAILARYRLGRHWSLRAIPGVTFREFTLLYRFPSGYVEKKNETVELSLPLHVVYKFAAMGRWTPSLLVGVQVSQIIDEGNSESRVLLQKTNFGVDVGIASEITTRHFVCRPELVYTFGINNLAAVSNNPYNSAIQNLRRDGLLLRLIFQ